MYIHGEYSPDVLPDMFNKWLATGEIPEVN
jgi:hypothetical protein